MAYSCWEYPSRLGGATRRALPCGESAALAGSLPKTTGETRRK